MKYFFLALFILNTIAVCGQTGKPTAVQTHNEQAFPDTSILANPQSLVGFWETMDSSAYRIEFKLQRGAFVLIVDSVDRYEFFSTGSSPSVSASGVQIRWPPYGCYVKPTGDDHLEIRYDYIFDGKLILIKYRRVKA